MNTPNLVSRRSFLRQAACAALGTAGLTNALFDLRRIAAASLGNSDVLSGDYKALVCLFLYGGNDANNMLVPRDTTDYDAYAASRGVLALPNVGQIGGILPLNVIAGRGSVDGRDFGLHPNLVGLQSLFNGGQGALLGNVGTLVAPITQTDYRNNRNLPPQLFSHSDQQVQWQTSVPDAISRSGWGGRTAELLNALNGNAQISICISLAGTNTFQVGNTVVPYNVSSAGAIGMNNYVAPGASGSANDVIRSRSIDRLLALSHTNLFEKGLSTITKRALDNNALLLNALALSDSNQGGTNLTTVFANTSLNNQLKMVARLIKARDLLGLRRQVFFVSVGGYDTHGDELNAHNNLYSELGGAVKSFYDATTELGVQNNVTLFSSSDFGRTFQTNGAGSDHGWGSHHFVVGGAVKGGGIYGKVPVLRAGGPDDATTGTTGQGRWIPTTSVDQYAATLASWFGVSPTDLPVALPNIGRFAQQNLGFI